MRRSFSTKIPSCSRISQFHWSNLNWSIGQLIICLQDHKYFWNLIVYCHKLLILKYYSTWWNLESTQNGIHVLSADFKSSPELENTELHQNWTLDIDWHLFDLGILFQTKCYVLSSPKTHLVPRFKPGSLYKLSRFPWKMTVNCW